jgi:hypothetical protein
MVLLDGNARSGTSLLARVMAGMLADHGFTYYYEPFFHDSPLGTYRGWEQMVARVAAPGDPEPELRRYISTMAASAPRVFWKEIRLALKQDWLFDRFPDLRIVHVTRDILGVLSSHRRRNAPPWMGQHRRHTCEAVLAWRRQADKLRSKRVPHLEILERLPRLYVSYPTLSRYHVPWRWRFRDRILTTEFRLYSAAWALNESFAWSLDSPRLLSLTYEDLCADPAPMVARLAEFLEVHVSDAVRAQCLAQIADTMQARDASGPGAGVPHADMPHVWKQRLQPRDIRSILHVSREVRRELGYPEIRAGAAS